MVAQLADKRKKTTIPIIENCINFRINLKLRIYFININPQISKDTNVRENKITARIIEFLAKPNKIIPKLTIKVIDE